MHRYPMEAGFPDQRQCSPAPLERSVHQANTPSSPTRKPTVNAERLRLEGRELPVLSEPFSSILEEIASELELRPLLTSIITRACGLLGADDGAIGLYEPRRHVVQIEAVHRLPEAELGIEFEPNEGLVGRVLATGKP